MTPHFYVDESGAFEERGDAVAAGGLLLDDVNVDIRASLEQAMPGFPWPLHAADVNRPIVWALAATASASASDEHTLPPPFKDVIATLRRSHARRLDDALGCMRRREWPGYEDLLALESGVRFGAPRSFRALNKVVKEGWARVGRVGAKLPGAAIVASEASWSLGAVDAVARRTGHLPTDRYYAVLQSALQRVRDVVARRGGSRLLVTVLSRNVHSVEHRRMQRLARADVERLVAELPPSSCVVVVHAVVDWRPDVPPPCVVADFCSNRALRILQDPMSRLENVEPRLTGQLGLAVRSGRPPRSHLAAAFPTGQGPWNDRRRSATSMVPFGIRRWAWEQLMEEMVES